MTKSKRIKKERYMRIKCIDKRLKTERNNEMVREERMVEGKSNNKIKEER